MSKLASQCIQISQHGDPKKVLILTTRYISKNLKDDQALVRWLASPVNPLDINLAQGNYAFRLLLPAIGGSEGVGVVEEVGSNVTHLKKGDKVITYCRSSIWTQFDVVNANYLIKIDSRIDLISAATLKINPPTAYLMLTNFVDLKPGDCIIQNLANSGVARSVIQIAKEFRIRTINLVRDRINIVELKASLTQLGADYVFTEEEFKVISKKFISGLGSKIKLALNGVGGRSALLVSSALDYGGTMITYGGMSKKPSEILTSSLVYKNIRVVGIMVGSFIEEEKNLEATRKMFSHLSEMIITGKLKPVFAELHKLSEYQTAVRNTMTPGLPKQIILLQDSSYYLEKSKL